MDCGRHIQVSPLQHGTGTHNRPRHRMDRGESGGRGQDPFHQMLRQSRNRRKSSVHIHRNAGCHAACVRLSQRGETLRRGRPAHLRDTRRQQLFVPPSGKERRHGACRGIRDQRGICRKQYRLSGILAPDATGRTPRMRHVSFQSIARTDHNNIFVHRKRHNLIRIRNHQP